MGMNAKGEFAPIRESLLANTNFKDDFGYEIMAAVEACCETASG